MVAVLHRRSIITRRFNLELSTVSLLQWALLRLQRLIRRRAISTRLSPDTRALLRLREARRAVTRIRRCTSFTRTRPVRAGLTRSRI